MLTSIKEESAVPYKPKNDLYALLHEVSISMGRGPRQGLVVRPGQNKVLKILDKKGTMRQKDLLSELGIRAGSLSELLRKLEDDNYIERKRAGADRREIEVSITERGRISALESIMSEKERDEELFSTLTDEERAQLSGILNKLLANWQESSGETEGVRRERRWRENTRMQEEQREVNALLEAVAQEKQVTSK